MKSKVFERVGTAFWDVAASAIAAAVAWAGAVVLFGHAHPIFAAVTAIVCLAPGLPNHARQAFGLMLGVVTGIAVGELADFLPGAFLSPDQLKIAQLVFATFFSMLIASTFGQPPVVAIQAGVSAVLVVALGTENAGLNRMADVAFGVGVGLAFSQIFFTPSPVTQIDKAARDFLQQVGAALRGVSHAAASGDAREGDAALRLLWSAHDSLYALRTGIDAARYAARWSLRGRLAAETVAEVAARYDRRAIRLYASALLFSESVANNLRRGMPVPDRLADLIGDAADQCAQIESVRPRPEAATQQLGPSNVDANVPDAWRETLNHLQAVFDALDSLKHASDAQPTTAEVSH